MIQYNKRDLSPEIPVEELRAKFNRYQAPDFLATATQAQGVLEPFKQASKMAVAAFQATAPK